LEFVAWYPLRSIKGGSQLPSAVRIGLVNEAVGLKRQRGAGDVALLAARLVGSEGEVVGIDTNPSIIETARARARDAGCSNVSFVAGDIRELSLPQDFDAVVGRYVLMFMPDPVAAMRAVVGHLRPGGIAAFPEPDFTQGP
jgi:ubiquinone/menaquinone biosynthesis C-methylase UbiE